jgi:thiamine biosynthesis lipoprotein
MALRPTYCFVAAAGALLVAIASLSCQRDDAQAPQRSPVTSPARPTDSTAAAAATTLPTTQPLARFEYTQIHMGVPVRLVVYATDENAAVNACRAAYARIRQIDDIASDYRKTSELNQLCARAATQPVKVSDDLWTLLKESQRLSQVTDGAFDITVGPLVQLWRAARKSGQMPKPDDIESAKTLVGWQKVQLNEADHAVKLAMPNMKLDLGGIAKGYAGDQAMIVLRQHGIRSALFEGGGDIVLSDAPPNAPGWRIALRYSGDNMPKELTLANAAVSTSGDTEQFVEINGRRYSHVVNPKTGIGLTNRSMATVTAPLGIHTDGLSTALTLVGEAKANEVLKTYPGARAWVRTVHD